MPPSNDAGQRLAELLSVLGLIETHCVPCYLSKIQTINVGKSMFGWFFSVEERIIPLLF